MNLLELQKLDFLLKFINIHQDSKNYKLVFGLNNQIFTGDFIPELYSDDNNITYKVKLKDNQNFNNDVYNYISITNDSIFTELRNVHAGYNKSVKTLLINRSKNNNEQEYFDLLFSNYKNLEKRFDFCEQLPTYIYNVKNLSIELPISFLKVDSFEKFDFVSLISEDKLKN